MTNKNTQDYLKFTLPILKDAVKPGDLVGVTGDPGNFQDGAAILLLKDFAENNPSTVRNIGSKPMILYINLDENIQTQVESVFQRLAGVDKDGSYKGKDTFLQKCEFVQSTFSKLGYQFTLADSVVFDEIENSEDPGFEFNKIGMLVNCYKTHGFEVKAISVVTSRALDGRLQFDLAKYVSGLCSNNNMLGIQTMVNGQGLGISSAIFIPSVVLTTTVNQEPTGVKIHVELSRCKHAPTGLKSTFDINEIDILYL